MASQKCNFIEIISRSPFQVQRLGCVSCSYIWDGVGDGELEKIRLACKARLHGCLCLSQYTIIVSQFPGGVPLSEFENHCAERENMNVFVLGCLCLEGKDGISCHLCVGLIQQ